MFTGIVEEVGTLRKIAETEDIHQYQVTASDKFLEKVSEGDSISVNGVCLTAYNIQDSLFDIDVSHETQSCTTFGVQGKGASVNLEQALTLSDKLGGHFVSGHVDGLGEIIDREEKENESILWISTPSNLKKYIATKGAICIDGVSLTVNEIKKDRHCLTIIPHTLYNTTLNSLKIGDKVNIEVDLLARYLEQLSRN